MSCEVHQVQLQQAEARALAAEAALAEIRNSTSWRVTAPLRFIRRMAGRLPGISDPRAAVAPTAVAPTVAAPFPAPPAPVADPAPAIARVVASPPFLPTDTQASIDEFTRISAASRIDRPFAFGAGVCREHHFRMPLYAYWCRAIGEAAKLHRKQWEFVFICQVLHERGMLRAGRRGLGFGVGREPLTALFANLGAGVMATDLAPERATELGWAQSNQHGESLADLNQRGLCDDALFRSLVDFRFVDMNRIPGDLAGFDFCWSACALEHLGSLAAGLDFVRNSLNALRPGGLAVHTTEFNLSSNDATLEHETLSIYRRRDIEDLIRSLEAEGHRVEPVDFQAGGDPLDQHVDLPPFVEVPHLRLELAGYAATSIGLIIEKAGGR